MVLGDFIKSSLDLCAEKNISPSDVLCVYDEGFGDFGVFSGVSKIYLSSNQCRVLLDIDTAITFSELISQAAEFSGDLFVGGVYSVEMIPCYALRNFPSSEVYSEKFYKDRDIAKNPENYLVWCLVIKDKYYYA